MAVVRIDLEVDASGAAKIKDVEGSLKSLSSAAKATQSILQGIGQALGQQAFVMLKAIPTFFQDSLKAQAESERQINSLNLALANQGHYTDEASKALTDYASALQDVTTYDDEAVVGAEAMLATFGMTTAQIEKTTKVALDFATATGRDLNEAVNVLGKAYLGHTANLGKLGITVDETKSRSEKFAQVLDQLNSRFGGSAQAATANYTGQMKQLGNAWNDAQEALGKFLGELLGGDAPFSTAIEMVKKLRDFFAVDLVIALSEVRAQILEFLATIVESPRFFGPLITILEKLGAPKQGLLRDLIAGGADAAKSLREQAAAVRETGDQHAQAAGNTLKFANATHVAKLGVDDLSKTLEKYNKDVAEEFNRVAGGAGVDLRSTEQVADDIQKALSKAPIHNLQLTPPVTVKPVFHFDPGSLTSFKDSLTKALNNLPQVILGAIQGGGKVGEAIGASIIGSIFGKDTKLVDKLTGTLQHLFGDTFGKALGAVLPGLGSLIGKGIGGLVDKLFGGLFGGKDKRAEQAKKDADEAAMMKPLQDQFNQLVVAAQRAGIQFDHTFDTHNAEALKNTITEIQNALDANAQAQQALNDALGRYNFTAAEKGPVVMAQELDQAFGQVLQDYKLLTAAGVDHNAVLREMGPKVSEYVNQAKEAGVAIPEAMKPVIDAMIQAGTLVDENGHAYGSAEEAGITYAKTMSAMFEDLLSKIDKLVNALLGIPDKTVTVNVGVNDPNGVLNGGGEPGPRGGEPMAGGFFGTVTRPRMFLVGENGPEDVTIRRSGSSGGRSGSGGAGGAPAMVEEHTHVYIGAEKLDEVITKRMRAGYIKVPA